MAGRRTFTPYMSTMTMAGPGQSQHAVQWLVRGRHSYLSLPLLPLAGSWNEGKNQNLNPGYLTLDMGIFLKKIIFVGNAGFSEKEETKVFGLPIRCSNARSGCNWASPKRGASPGSPMCMHRVKDLAIPCCFPRDTHREPAWKGNSRDSNDRHTECRHCTETLNLPCHGNDHKQCGYCKWHHF